MKTIKTKGFPLKTGGLQQQPTLSQFAALKSESEKTNNSQSVIDVPTKTKTIDLLNDDILQNKSVKDLVQSVSEGNVIPIQQSSTTKTIPSYDSGMQIKGGVRSSNDLNVSFKTIPTISSDRPEIIGVFEYKELLRPVARNNKESSLTNHGLYFNAQLQARTTARKSSTFSIKESLLENDELKIVHKQHQATFAEKINNLNELTKFLLQVVQKIETTNRSLDVRSVAHVTDIFDELAHVLTSGGSLSTPAEFLTKNAMLKLTAHDALSSVGFNKSSIDAFTSTKCWLQILSDLKDSLQYHSSTMIGYTEQSRMIDVSSTNLQRQSIKKFSLVSNFSGYTLTQLAQIQQSTLALAVNNVAKSIESLLNGTHFKDSETKIAVLLNAVANEFRDSSALLKEDVQKLLAEEFGYAIDVTTKNDRLYDVVLIGKHASINDIPTQADRSLASIAYQRSSTETVAVFETSFRKDGTLLLTPGSEKFVDACLDITNLTFNTIPATTLFKALDKKLSATTKLFTALNLIETSKKQNSTLENTLTSSKKLLDYVLDYFLDKQSLVPKPALSIDKIASVYALGLSDTQLKSELFLHTITKVLYEQAIGNTSLSAVTDTLAFNIQASVERLTKNKSIKNLVNSSQTQNATETLNRDAIVYAFKSSSPIIKLMSNVMSDVMSTFNSAVNVDLTVHAGAQLINVLLATFEMLMTLVAQLSTFELSGQTTIKVNNTLTSVYALKKSQVDVKTVVSSLVSKIESETLLRHKLMLTVTRILNSVSSNLKTMIEFLTSSTSQSRLADLYDIFQDFSLVKQLMTEQQIMNVASTLEDLASKSAQLSSIENLTEQTLFLDDLLLSTKVRDVIVSALNAYDSDSSQYNNKKIFSIGIPAGFYEHLKNIVDKTSQAREKDVVNVCVYKTDVQNPDLIFKPLKYMFELSRFPVRDDSKFLSYSDTQDVFLSIPMRELGTGVSNEEYLNTAFSTRLYDFLTDLEKESLAKNHIMSFVLELYLSALTGIVLSDERFFVKSVRAIAPPSATQSTLKKIIDTRVSQLLTQKVSNKTNSAIALPSTQKFTQPPAKKQHLAQVKLPGSQLSSTPQKEVENVISEISAISAINGHISSLLDPMLLAKKVLMPRLFDRVFNLLVDPDDFEIDYEETVSTKAGKLAIDRLLKSGDIKLITDVEATKRAKKVPFGYRTTLNQGRQTNTQIFKARIRDKEQGDITFDRYFVTVEAV